MRPAAFGLMLVLLGPSSIAGQIAVTSQEQCRIEGVVVKSTTGLPLKKAVVTAQRSAPNEPQRSAVTDLSGRFAFENLSPGEYFLWANRDGYLGWGYGQQVPNGPGKTLTIKPGQHIRDVVFRLMPMGAISGRVYDEDGEPLSGVSVQALRYGYFNGRRDFQQVSGTGTNDLGEYRLIGLPPDRYYVAAVYNNPNSNDESASNGYIPVYYPGTNDPKSAVPVEVATGEEVSQADLTLTPVPAVRLRGQVLNLVAGQAGIGLNVALMRSDAGVSTYQNSFVNNAQGTFEMRGVPPGSYVLIANWYDKDRQYFGRETIEVGNSDIDGINLVVGPGSEVRGYIHVEGNAQWNPASLQIFLQPQDLAPMGVQPVTVESDGTFVLKNISDGQYLVNVSGMPEGFYLKAAHFGSEDILESSLNLSQTRDPGALDLVLSPAGGRIDGVVLKQLKPFGGATVVLIPEASRRSQVRLFLSTGTDSNGRFSLVGVPPGDYQLFAWETVENGAYLDPDFLRPYEERGKRVRIDEGSKLNVEVELVSAGDHQP